MTQSMFNSFLSHTKLVEFAAMLFWCVHHDTYSIIMCNALPSVLINTQINNEKLCTLRLVCATTYPSFRNFDMNVHSPYAHFMCANKVLCEAPICISEVPLNFWQCFTMPIKLMCYTLGKERIRIRIFFIHVSNKIKQNEEKLLKIAKNSKFAHRIRCEFVRQ